MNRVIAFAIEAGGMPIPRGGGARLVDALVRLIEDNGGSCRADQDVERVLVADGRATGVRTKGGDVFTARRAVICNVTPTQLYGRLLELDGDVAGAGRRFRFGRSEMQIHFALSEPPRWNGDERLAKHPTVPRTPGPQRRPRPRHQNAARLRPPRAAGAGRASP